MPEKEAGRPSEPPREAAHIQRAERPKERPLPQAPELPLQRPGETKSLGFRLPCFCVSTLQYNVLQVFSQLVALSKTVHLLLQH